MIDIDTYNNSKFDIDFENGDIKASYDLRMAIFMSVFCEKRADAYFVENIENRRGHYTNQFNKQQNYEIGSFYWYFTEQEKVSENIKEDLQDTINENLQWLVDDGYLNEIECNIDIVNNKYIINISYIDIFNQKANFTI